MPRSLSQIVSWQQVVVAVGLLISIALAACGGDSKPPPVTVEPTMASIQAEIFTPTCATSNCHSSAQGEAGLVLEAGMSHQNLVGVVPTTRDAQLEGLLRVDPNDPDNSFLIQKLRGVPATKGRRMPNGGPYLSDGEIDVIEEWITNGAPE
ncbi:MAG: hypothetical protein SGI90_07710 [Candidatus Eisenbacteria bacterium]|nr:hypothetical protein [Candidatus Eisenbacteria bacterium]